MRRGMYARYSNFMTLFDRFQPVFDQRYESAKDRVLHFDSSFELWRLRQLRKAQWRVWKNRDKEAAKHSKDQLSQIID